MKRIATPAKTYLACGILWICTASVFAAFWHFEEIFGYPLTARGGGHVDPTQAHVAVFIVFAFWSLLPCAKFLGVSKQQGLTNR